MNLINPISIIALIYFIILFYLLFTKNKKFYDLMISSALSLVWLFISKSQYGYNQNFTSLANINLFPLFAWATGLFLVYHLYPLKKNSKNFIEKFLLFIIFYGIILIIAETIGYYVFNIHNIATAMYNGLPICNCLHAPLWMQISYFALGPIFYIIRFIAKPKNI